jgi:hypothetical protein
MKTAGQVAQKLKQVRFRHLKRELIRLLRVSGENCVNSRRVKTPTGHMRICVKDNQTCDALVEDRADSCGMFQQSHTREEIKESLQTFFRERPTHEVSVRFPDVAALMWALQDPDDPQAGAMFPGALPCPTFFGIEVWIDSPGEVAVFQEAMLDWQTRAALADTAADLLECLSEDLHDTLVSKLGLLDAADKYIADLTQLLGGEADSPEARVQELLESEKKLEHFLSDWAAKKARLLEKELTVDKRSADLDARERALVPVPRKGLRGVLQRMFA